MKSNFTDFLHYIKYFCPQTKKGQSKFALSYSFACLVGPQKNHNFIYILPREKRGFQRLKPTISLGTYKYCSEKRTTILRLIKPFSSLDIIFFSQTQRGERKNRSSAFTCEWALRRFEQHHFG